MERDYTHFPDDDNGEVLWELRCAGDALVEPREIDFSAIFPSQKAARKFAAAFSNQHRVEVERAEEHQEDGLDWEVLVYINEIPTHARITEFEAALERQAAALGGRTSGWSAIFVPSAEPIPRDLWWTYLGSYGDLLGSTTINLGLKDHAPLSGYTTLLITGVSYESRSDKPELKMPERAELEFLNQVSEKRVALVTSRPNAVFVGAFLHDNQQLDYFYVADADGLEAALQQFHQAECPTRRHFFSTHSDAEWKEYLNFLYPNEATIEHYRAELEKLGAL
jgi:hypothetical protein